jgi:hypothetical protein
VKNLLSSLALRWLHPRLLRDENGLHRLLGQAVHLQWGRISDDHFRRELSDFFTTLDRSSLMEMIDFPAKAQRLNRPGGYKIDLVSLRADQRYGPLQRRLSPWARRFGLLRRLGIRMDVLILRAGEQVPPHGHNRIVSGFYVLEGQVAIRHFDRVREEGNGVLVRKVLDTVLEPGGYTTNSEFYHNIHWLYGLAPCSYLFRVTVTNTPTEAFGGQAMANERVYLDPSGPPDEQGLIAAPYLSEAEVKQVQFVLVEEGATSG